MKYFDTAINENIYKCLFSFMYLFLFPLHSAKVFFSTIADKRLMLNFGQPKKQMHKNQPKRLDHMRQNSLWSTATKHVTLNRVKGSFRDNSQGRSGFSSEESCGLLWDGAIFFWVIL